MDIFFSFIIAILPYEQEKKMTESHKSIGITMHKTFNGAQTIGATLYIRN